MNCRESEPLLVEAARGNLNRADVQSALEHAADCSACLDRLAEERAVSAHLRALAAEPAPGPSAGCEATLMAAYRMERTREVRTRRWIFAVSGAMAASLAVLLGAALMLSSESSWLVRSMSSRLGPLSAQHAATAPGTSQVASSQTPAGSVAGESGQEDVTEFMAFYPGADVNAADGGALVRVRVPSSELTAFGLPVGTGAEDQWVSADLLVGEDGSPQAIRFVRTTPQPAGAKD